MYQHFRCQKNFCYFMSGERCVDEMREDPWRTLRSGLHSVCGEGNSPPSSLLMAALNQETPQWAAAGHPELSYPHWNLSLRLWTSPGAFLAGVPPVATPGKAEGLVWPGQRGCFAAGPRYPPAYLPPISPDLNWAWHAPVERDSPGIKALLLWFGLAADVKHDMILEDFLSLPWNKAATGIKRALCWGCNHITNWTLPHVRAGTSTLAYLTCICPKVQMLRSWHSIIWI